MVAVLLGRATSKKRLKDKPPILKQRMTSEEDLELTRQDIVRAYNRIYYHTHKKPTVCEYCQKTFCNKSALTRHQKRNLKCQIKQLLHQQSPKGETQET
jgi:uncharacterized Zn-finger protein